MTKNLILLSLAYFETKWTHGILACQGYWSISCSSLHHLLWMKQLWQAEGRRTIQKSVFSCPTLAFHCCGSSSGQSSACLHPCKCLLPSQFSISIPPWQPWGSWQLMGSRAATLTQCRAAPSCGVRAALMSWARCWQGSAWGWRGSA